MEQGEEHSEHDYVNIFCKYFEHHLEQFEDVMLSESTRHYYPIYVDAMMLLNLNAKVGHMLLTKPKKLLPLAEQSGVAMQEAMLMKIETATNIASLGLHHDPKEYTVKRNIKVRVVNLPLTADFYKRSITALRAEDVGPLIAVRGIVIREGTVRMFEATREYACERCHATIEGRKTIAMLSPVHGPGVSQRPPICIGCNKAMTAVASTKQEAAPQLRDYQEIKLQDQVTNLKAGTIPRSITVVLEDDLAESCRAGDDLVTVGVLTERWNKEPKPDQRCAIEMVLHANYIQVTNENKTATNVSLEDEDRFEEFWEAYADNKMEGRNVILSHICPDIFGMHRVKLGLMLVLIGGYAVEMEKEGSRTRGVCHMLLVGDPGTAKSQFLQFASKMSSRSVCTTGVGSTSAGLTVSAFKDGGEWVLDAGALVLADGGVCCIDEFSTIPEQKHIAIHEAMEQQTISIAKAGLVTTLNTRCSVIAACNPKKDQSVADGETAIGIATPLLSRFDLVMVLLDTHNEVWDSALADHVLAKAEAAPYDPEKQEKEATQDGTLEWGTETLKTYIEWLKQKKKNGLPPMTKAASLLIQRYYNWQRECRSALNKSRRTVRMLESLIRLAQAHSLLVNDTEVKLRDAVVAVSLMTLSGEGPGSTDNSPLHTVAPSEPERDLLQTQEILLKQLGLADHEFFKDERRLSPDPFVSPCKLATDSRYAYPAPDATDTLTNLFASRKTRAEEVRSQPVAPSTKGIKRKRGGTKVDPLPALDLDGVGTPVLPKPPNSGTTVGPSVDSPRALIPIPLTLRSDVECTPPVLITPTVREQSAEVAAAADGAEQDHTQDSDTGFDMDFGMGGGVQPLDLDLPSQLPTPQDPFQHLSFDSAEASFAWDNLDVNAVHPSRLPTPTTPQEPVKNKPTFRRGGLGNANRMARKKTKLKTVESSSLQD